MSEFINECKGFHSWIQNILLAVVAWDIKDGIKNACSLHNVQNILNFNSESRNESDLGLSL